MIDIFMNKKLITRKQQCMLNHKKKFFSISLSKFKYHRRYGGRVKRKLYIIGKKIKKNRKRNKITWECLIMKAYCIFFARYIHLVVGEGQ